MANITGERETFVVRMLGWNEAIEVVGSTTNVADVPQKRNIV